MARNFYSEIHLHITWHTKLSQPLLTPAIEPVAHQSIRQKIINWPGAFVHEINGTATHVHVVVTIVPTIAISEFIGQLEGSVVARGQSEVWSRAKAPRMADRLRGGEFRDEGPGMGPGVCPQSEGAPCSGEGDRSS